MRRVRLLMLAFSIASLSACTTTRAPAEQASPSASTASRAPTPQVAPPAASASSPCDEPLVGAGASAATGARAVVVDVCDTGSRDGPHATALRAYPVELPSLTPVPGVRPISFQHHFQHSLSPDGRTLAAVLWPSGSGNGGGRLHLIDVATWTDTPTEVELDQAVGRIEHAVDGSAIYWLKPTAFDAAHGMPRSYAVYRYDLRTRKVTELLRLPASFLPYDHRIAGDRLAVFGVPTSTENMAESAPQVHVVDLTRGTLVATATLAGIRAGQFKIESDPDRYPYLSVRPGIAWDLPRQRLFVVDAEADRAIAIDLVTGSTGGPRPFGPRPASLLDHLLRWLFPVAEAKMTSETARDAVVSPDGSRVYVRGLRSEFVKSGGSWREVVTPLGLRAIDTASMTEVARIDDPVDEVALSDDGKVLLYVTFRAEDSGQEWAKRTGYRLHVWDTAALRTVRTAELGEGGRVAAIAPDGRVAYFVSWTSPGPRVRAFSLTGGSALAEIRGIEVFISLIPLWRPAAR